MELALREASLMHFQMKQIVFWLFLSLHGYFEVGLHTVVHISLYPILTERFCFEAGLPDLTALSIFKEWIHSVHLYVHFVFGVRH